MSDIDATQALHGVVSGIDLSAWSDVSANTLVIVLNDAKPSERLREAYPTVARVDLVAHGRHHMYDVDTVLEALDWWATHRVIGRGECHMTRDEHGTWHCSACEDGADTETGCNGALTSWNDSWAPNYCPYCGARRVDERARPSSDVGTASATTCPRTRREDDK